MSQTVIAMPALTRLAEDEANFAIGLPSLCMYAVEV